MSLDVTLYDSKETTEPCTCSQCGNAHTHTYREELYSSNITHNLGAMAEEAGIYKHLWRPDELNIFEAGQLVYALQTGLALMLVDPKRFRKHDAANGWGTYDSFIPFVREYLAACEKYPNAIVSVCRWWGT